MIAYEEIIKTMLEKIPDDVDKREGSLIFTALAPVAAMVAEQQFYSDNIMDATMPDTARGINLTRKCAEKGINRYPASRSIRKAVFTDSSGKRKDIPLGYRFGAQGIIYTALMKISQGEYQMECQQPGIEGNSYFGSLLPIDIVPDLSAAALTDVLIAGEDEESDDELRQRYYTSANTQPAAGNIAYYETEIAKISGVGGIKVFPTPDNQGGKVQCVIVDPSNKPVSSTLVAQVQQIIDPAPSGQGYGKAPIGHNVTISTVTETTINITSTISLVSGYELSNLTTEIQKAVSDYLASLSFKDNIVRISRVEAALLNVEGIADISGTKLNEGTTNITLPNDWNDYQVPKLGSINVTEAV